VNGTSTPTCVQEAKRYGLSVFRVFATGGEFSGFILQPGPGERQAITQGRSPDAHPIGFQQATAHARERLDLSSRCSSPWRAMLVLVLHSAGRYNETVFKAIDYMLAQAGNYGLKVHEMASHCT
jgi:hypothetical protein